MSFALALLLAAQTTSVAPIEKGTALPPPDGQEAAVLASVRTLLRAIGDGDTPAIVAATRSEGGATIAGEGAQPGIRHQSWTAFAAALRPEGARREQRIVEPAVEVDGDIAMVWARSAVLAGSAVESCGYGHFDLVRAQGAWKVLNATWSQRTAGCTAR